MPSFTSPSSTLTKIAREIDAPGAGGWKMTVVPASSKVPPPMANGTVARSQAASANDSDEDMDVVTLRAGNTDCQILMSVVSSDGGVQLTPSSETRPSLVQPVPGASMLVGMAVPTGAV